MYFRHLISLLLLCMLNTTVSAQVYDYSKGFTASPKVVNNKALAESLPEDNVVLPGEISRKQNELLKSNYRDRTRATKEILKSENLISSGILYDYVNSIFRKIVTSNPEIPADTRMYLVNDAVTNAYTLGNNIIFINTGLIYTMKNSGELAFVISHEIAHNSFHHTDSKILNSVMRMTDKELNDQIAKASRQEYQSVSALNQLLVPRVLEEKERSRKFEIEADSLGVIFMTSAGFSVSESVSCFEKLQSLEDFKSQPEVNLLSLIAIPDSSSITRKAGNYRPSNSLGVFTDTNDFTSYLRSHPYGKQRKAIVISGFNLADSVTTLSDSVYNSYRYLANGEIVRQSISDGNLSEAFFYGLQMKNYYPEDQYSTGQLAFITGELSFLKKQRKSGKYVELQSNKHDQSYDRTLCLLQNLNPDECQQLSEYIMTGVKSDDNSAAELATRTVWAFNKGLYEEYSIRNSVAAGFTKETEYEFYLTDMKEYFIISGKAKTINK